MEEQFDIFDENNLPLGISKSRSLVHAETTDWHRTTHIWIINDDKQILCQQRSLDKDKNPGEWQSFFGGHVKAGQSYDESAVSELAEELGINIPTDQLIPLYIRKSETVKHFAQVYLLNWQGNLNDLTFDDGEVAKIEWVNLADMEEKIKSEHFCNSMDQQVVDYLQNN